jgi:hypothetical protein
METVRDALQEVGEPVGMPEGLCGGTLADPRVRDQLTHRFDLDPREARRRQLRGRRELPERFDLVAPVLQADGTASDPREDVDDAPAHGELPAALDHVGPLIPELHQALGQSVRRKLPPRDQLERRLRPERGNETLHRGERRRDHDGRALGFAETPDRRRPPGGDVRRRRDPFVRERLPCGEDGDVPREERLQVVREGLCLVRSGADREHGGVERDGQGRDREGLPGLGARLDRPLARQQQPLERLRGGERLQRFLHTHRDLFLDRTPWTEQHEQPRSRRDGACRKESTGARSERRRLPRSRGARRRPGRP